MLPEHQTRPKHKISAPNALPKYAMAAAADSRSGSPTSTLCGPDVNVFVVTGYNNKSVLAHTPSGEPTGAGVYSVQLDADSGRLRLLGEAAAGPNPAFVLAHPTRPEVLYISTGAWRAPERATGVAALTWACAREYAERIDADGDVLAFVREPSGALRLLSRRSSVRPQCGAQPCSGATPGAP